MLAAPAREWLVGVSSLERLADTAAMVATGTRRFAATALLEQARRDFDEAVERGVDGEGAVVDVTDGTIAEDAERSADEEADGVPAAARSKVSLPETACIAGQRFAVISAVDADEFLLKVHGCFDDMAEADAWVRNVASHHVKEYHLDIVTTCTWICPGRTTKAKGAFRNEELDKIMQHQRREPERVVEYRDWMK